MEGDAQSDDSFPGQRFQDPKQDNFFRDLTIVVICQTLRSQILDADARRRLRWMQAGGPAVGFYLILGEGASVPEPERKKHKQWNSSGGPFCLLGYHVPLPYPLRPREHLYPFTSTSLSQSPLRPHHFSIAI